LAEAMRVGRIRLVIAAICFVMAFGAVGVRMTDLAWHDGQPSRLAAGMRGVGQGSHGGETQPAMRGDIVDRNGMVLATDLPIASLYADPALILDPAEAVEQLREIFPELDAVWLLDEFSSDKRFVWLKRGLTPTQTYEVNRLGIPGFAFMHETRRFYPHGNLTAHLVGYTNIDGRGLAGLERSYDHSLAPGNLENGNLENGAQQNEGNGEALVTSIDIRLQNIVRSALDEAMVKHQAIGGAAVVMDARNGEILSLVSLPDFSPLEPGAAQDDHRFNRAAQGVYELGSVFKIVNTAIALETGAVRMDEGFDAREPIEIGGFRIRDFHAQERVMTPAEILVHSSNIGSALMAQRVGVERQRQYFDLLGLTRAGELELPERGRPVVPQHWREINLMTMSYGHGIAVTPVQLTAAIAATVNDGRYHPPTLLHGVHDPQEDPQIFSPQTVQEMRRMLRMVITEGTGSHADVSGYFVGGKTGTAEKIGPNGYEDDALISSFVGVYPMYDPAYVIYVMLDEPQPTADTHGYATGGWVAAPVVGDIISAMAPMYGLPPAGPQDIELLVALYGDDTEALQEELAPHMMAHNGSPGGEQP